MFEIRPKGTFDFYRLERSTFFSCGVRNFARAVLRRTEELARLDEDDKAGEPFGFTSLMRHNAFVGMANCSTSGCEVDDPQLVRDRLRGSQIDATCFDYFDMWRKACDDGTACGNSSALT